MTTSARITSGRSSRALITASSPLSVETISTSSLAKDRPTSFWITTESSASSSVLDIDPPDSGAGRPAEATSVPLAPRIVSFRRVIDGIFAPS